MTAIRVFCWLLLHDWADLRRNITLWVMVTLPVVLSVFIVQLMDDSGAPVHLTVPMWVLFAQVMIGVMTLVLNYVDEKEKGTLEALSLTTVGPHRIAAAKMVFVLLLSVVGQLIVLGINQGFVGNVPLLLGVVLLGGAVFVGVGMVVSVFVRTERTGAAIASAVMVLFFLSGVVFDPDQGGSEVLQWTPGVLSIELTRDSMAEAGAAPGRIVALAGWGMACLLVAHLKLSRDRRR